MIESLYEISNERFISLSDNRISENQRKSIDKQSENLSNFLKTLQFFDFKVQLSDNLIKTLKLSENIYKLSQKNIYLEYSEYFYIYLKLSDYL